jgi:hypothetical protein
MGMVMVDGPQLIWYHTEANRNGASIDLTASNKGTLKKKRSGVAKSIVFNGVDGHRMHD